MKQLIIIWFLLYASQLSAQLDFLYGIEQNGKVLVSINTATGDSTNINTVNTGGSFFHHQPCIDPNNNLFYILETDLNGNRRLLCKAFALEG